MNRAVILIILGSLTLQPVLAGTGAAPNGLLDERKDPYRKLARLYERDKDKCLNRSVHLSKRSPQLPSPHYFSATIYFDKYRVEKTLRKKASAMTRALSSVRLLYRSDTARWAGNRSWKEPVDIILDSARVLTRSLLIAKDTSRASNISRKYEGITGTSLMPSRTQPKKADVTVNSTYGFRNGQYFGMPMGTEEVASHSELKEKQLLQLINAERRKRGMKELVWEEDLSRAARYHAYDMAKQGYFEHDSYDSLNGELVEIGGTFERIRKFYSRSFVNSENLAAGSSDALGTYNQWFSSAGHNANMFNSSSGKVGIGVHFDPNSKWQYYWVFCTAY
ncbi:MAG: CAP domain-containing protein [Flavobacteriales bacterium]|nr:CAP domain-containing protein [Flavobacteriales bacterium]